MDRVIDLSEIDASGITATGVERTADQVAEFSNEIKTGRLALVAGVDSPLKFGLARMFAAYFGAQVDAPILVSETLDEALDWLDSAESRISPASEDDAGDTTPGEDDPRTLSGSTD